MTILKTNLPATAQKHFINSEVAATLAHHGLFIQIEVQLMRPDTNWSFYGKASYVQYATDLIIDTTTIDTVKKLRDEFGFSSQRTVIVPIYNNNNVFNHLSDNDSELIGFAVVGLVQSAELGCFGSANHQHESKLNEREVHDDIDNLTLWKKKEIFQAYLTDANGDLVAHIQDINNHHRDLEVAINHRLKCIEIGKKLSIAA